MLHSTCRIGLVAALLGLSVLIAAPPGQEKTRSWGIQDDAKLFSAEAIDRAGATIKQIREKFHKDVRIETVEQIPEDVKNYSAWARDRFHKEGINGVYIVIGLKPKHYEVVVGNHTAESGLFTIANRNEAGNLLKANLAKNHDEALKKVVDYIEMTMQTAEAKIRPRRVQDEAKLFSPEAVAKADAVIRQIKLKHHKDLWIETLEKGPPRDKAPEWARERFNSAGVDGVYVVITKEPRHFEVINGNKTRESGMFTAADVTQVVDVLKSNLGKKADEALTKLVEDVAAAMDKHAKATAAP